MLRRVTVLNLLPFQLVFPAYTCSHRKYQTILPSYPCWRGFPWPGGPCSFRCWPRSVGWCGRRTRRRCRQPWRGWPETRRLESRSTSTSYRRGPPGIKWRNYSEKYAWLYNSLLYRFQCCWQVLQTSTDRDQKFSANFKAGNSRQVQTSYKPTIQTKETATFSNLHQYRRNGSSHDLETLSALCMQAFTLLLPKVQRFCRSRVKHCRYRRMFNYYTRGKWPKV